MYHANSKLLRLFRITYTQCDRNNSWVKCDVPTNCIVNKYKFIILQLASRKQYIPLYPPLQICQKKPQKSSMGYQAMSMPIQWLWCGSSLLIWPLSVIQTQPRASHFRQMTQFFFWCKQMSLPLSICECIRRTWLLMSVPVLLPCLLPPIIPTWLWVRFHADQFVAAWCVVSWWVKMKCWEVMSSAAAVRVLNAEVWCWPSSLQQRSMLNMT